MTDVTPFKPIGSVAAKRPVTKNMLLIAVSLASTSVFVGYMSLVGIYLSNRADMLALGETWLPDGVKIPLTQPNFMAVSMVFSLITAWWAYASTKNDDRSNSLIAHSLTLLFGFGFVAQTFYLLSLMNMGAADSSQSVFIYSLIGVHLILCVLGIVNIVLTTVRTIVGDFSSENYDAVLGSAIFWTLIVTLYSVLWYTVYITK